MNNIIFKMLVLNDKLKGIIILYLLQTFLQKKKKKKRERERERDSWTRQASHRATLRLG